MVVAKAKARPHGVNDLLARERACDRNLGVARVAALVGRVAEERQLLARVLKLDAALVVDLSVNATSTKAALVGRVDDGVARKVHHAVVRNVELGVRSSQLQRIHTVQTVHKVSFV